VRALILRLRDRGCTVFFSSHVLSDAEALCSRVAILARGRLVTAGRLTDMIAFQIRGWELVAANVSEQLAGALTPRATKLVKLGDGRFTIELPLDMPPDRILGELSAAGASVVSLNPVRETLEDFFVQQVSAPEVQAHDRWLDRRA
jgi:ABC-2 type transport system ATP-binding protein